MAPRVAYLRHAREGAVGRRRRAGEGRRERLAGQAGVDDAEEASGKVSETSKTNSETDWETDSETDLVNGSEMGSETDSDTDQQLDPPQTHPRAPSPCRRGGAHHDDGQALAVEGRDKDLFIYIFFIYITSLSAP